MHLATYLGLLHHAEHTLAEAFRRVGDGHAAEPDVFHLCEVLARQCDRHTDALVPVVERHDERRETEPERLLTAGLGETRSGGVGLLRDLQDLYTLASFVDITWTVVGQAGQGLADRELLDVVGTCERETAVQLRWLRTRIKQAAPQALIAAR
ncbi:hypothetical protein [Pseudonocardia hydrocarbonoxydans]|uniref:DUF892 domain-containing protein n=1 Tax=Pseudonocardia hydrocarbonoxydans TaxID=76726 RepID=A0A4Y3WR70_9PSEU|nr:hypothetical protein [Pseudonocardia hydrocarbonoxydans]GEC21382.1 hypothetical protein PHY01_36650 [Pseudonocardia hydrocarbonoxydans]